MPTYRSAYRIGDLRRFPGWRAEAGATLDEDELVFIDEALVVTTAVIEGAEVLFAGDVDGWDEFVGGELGFSVPDWGVEASGTAGLGQ